MICVSFGPAPQSISLPVIAERDGAAWIVRPSAGTLRMTLREVQGGLEGTLSGSATHQGTTIQINHTTGDPATVSASTNGVSSPGGFVEGHVQFSGPQGSGSCSGNAWSLVRR